MSILLRLYHAAGCRQDKPGLPASAGFLWRCFHDHPRLGCDRASSVVGCQLVPASQRRAGSFNNKPSASFSVHPHLQSRTRGNAVSILVEVADIGGWESGLGSYLLPGQCGERNPSSLCFERKALALSNTHSLQTFHPLRGS